MECQEAVVRLAALVDDGQSPQGDLAAHLDACAACRQVRERLAALDHELEAWAGAFAPAPDFDARLMARIQAEAESVRRARQFREATRFDAAQVSTTVRRDAWRAGVQVVLEALSWGSLTAILLYAGLESLAAHATLPTAGTVLTGVALAVAVGLLLLTTRPGNRALQRWMSRLVG